jgi:uncharacterized protein with ParB-like and HNH nuclease domain
MKAVDANLLEFLKKGTQFVAPIYQRVYLREIPECERLWDDIVQAGKEQCFRPVDRPVKGVPSR